MLKCVTILCVMVMSAYNLKGKEVKILQDQLRPVNASCIFFAWAKKLRELSFLVTYGNVTMVGNIKSAVWALWHPICTWTWAWRFPNPSETRSNLCFALLFLHCRSGLLTLGIKSVKLLHISIGFISTAISMFETEISNRRKFIVLLSGPISFYVA